MLGFMGSLGSGGWSGVGEDGVGFGKVQVRGLGSGRSGRSSLGRVETGEVGGVGGIGGQGLGSMGVGIRGA